MRDALQKLDALDSRYVAVVEPSNRLIGVISYRELAGLWELPRRLDATWMEHFEGWLDSELRSVIPRPPVTICSA